MHVSFDSIFPRLRDIEDNSIRSIGSISCLWDAESGYKPPALHLEYNSELIIVISDCVAGMEDLTADGPGRKFKLLTVLGQPYFSHFISVYYEKSC